MADYTFNAPGTTADPYTPPSSLIVPAGAMQSDATGVFVATSALSAGYFMAAHNAAYGLSVTATATVSAISGNDFILVGQVVRSGANAGAFVGAFFDMFGDVRLGGIDTSGGDTFISSNTNYGTPSLGDVMLCNVLRSGSSATLSVTVNGTNVTFDNNTTNTSTLAWLADSNNSAGFGVAAGNTNHTKVSQFTGTGVSSGGVPPSQFFFSAAPIVAPLSWIIRRRQQLQKEGVNQAPRRSWRWSKHSRLFLPHFGSGSDDK